MPRNAEAIRQWKILRTSKGAVTAAARARFRFLTAETLRRKGSLRQSLFTKCSHAATRCEAGQG